MRILITGTTYYPALNGQSIFMVNLAEGLAARGHQVAVLYPEAHSVSKERNGVQLEPVGSVSLQFIHTESYAPFVFAKVGRLFDSFKPDILHIHDHYPLSVVSVRQAKRRGIPVIGTNHYSPDSLEPYLPGSGLLKPLYDRILWEWMLRLYRRLDYVTAPSTAAVKVLLDLGLKVPTQAVSCGADLSRFHPDASLDRAAIRREYGLDEKRKLFVYVGRVDAEKRIDVLLRAVNLLDRQDIQLAIAGQGAAKPGLERLAQALALGDRVRFIGPVRNEALNRLLNAADVFSLAGEAESLSIASLEAMACGKPVLLADAFALPQLIDQGKNGYLFKSGSPEDAAHYMGLLLDRAGTWAEMGRLSIQKVKPHSLEETLERYTMIYVQMLEDAPALRPIAGPALNNKGAEIAHRSGPT
jgi:1,2-diacylglycerol 3-alpha-glucosyltransferase